MNEIEYYQKPGIPLWDDGVILVPAMNVLGTIKVNLDSFSSEILAFPAKDHLNHFFNSPLKKAREDSIPGLQSLVPFDVQKSFVLCSQINKNRISGIVWYLRQGVVCVTFKRLCSLPSGRKDGAFCYRTLPPLLLVLSTLP